MNRLDIALGLALTVASTGPAWAAPTLAARTTCEETALEPGQVRTVSIDLTGDGQALGALGFTLRVDPALLLVQPQDVSLGEAGRRAGADVTVRPGPAPGTVLVQVVPTVRTPVAAIPDGEVVRVAVRVPDAVPGGCATFTIEAATFHDDRVGFRVAGSARGGSVATISCPSRIGVPGVRCRIAVVRSLNQDAGADAVSARTRKKIDTLTRRILTRLDASQTAAPKRARKLLRSVGKLTRALTRTIDRRARKGRLDPDLAAQMKAQTSGAATLLAGVLSPTP